MITLCDFVDADSYLSQSEDVLAIFADNHLWGSRSRQVLPRGVNFAGDLKPTGALSLPSLAMPRIWPLQVMLPISCVS